MSSIPHNNRELEDSGEAQLFTENDKKTTKYLQDISALLKRRHFSEKKRITNEINNKSDLNFQNFSYEELCVQQRKVFLQTLTVIHPIVMKIRPKRLIPVTSAYIQNLFLPIYFDGPKDDISNDLLEELITLALDFLTLSNHSLKTSGLQILNVLQPVIVKYRFSAQLSRLFLFCMNTLSADKIKSQLVSEIKDTLLQLLFNLTSALTEEINRDNEMIEIDGDKKNDYFEKNTSPLKDDAIAIIQALSDYAKRNEEDLKYSNKKWILPLKHIALELLQFLLSQSQQIQTFISNETIKNELIAIILSQSLSGNLRSLELSLQLFGSLLSLGHKFIKKEIEIIFNNVIFSLLHTNISQFEERIIIIQFIDRLFKSPDQILSLYINFDSQIVFTNLLNETFDLLKRTFFTVLAPPTNLEIVNLLFNSMMSMFRALIHFHDTLEKNDENNSALLKLLHNFRSIKSFTDFEIHQINEFLANNDPNNIKIQPSFIDSIQNRKDKIARGITIFKENPLDAIQYFIAESLLENSDHAIAVFLNQHSDILHCSKINYFGTNRQVFEEYLSFHDYRYQKVEIAFYYFLYHISYSPSFGESVLPLIQDFAKKYFDDNTGLYHNFPFKSSDSVYSLCLVLLKENGFSKYLPENQINNTSSGEKRQISKSSVSSVDNLEDSSTTDPEINNNNNNDSNDIIIDDNDENSVNDHKSDDDLLIQDVCKEVLSQDSLVNFARIVPIQYYYERSSYRLLTQKDKKLLMNQMSLLGQFYSTQFSSSTSDYSSSNSLNHISDDQCKQLFRGYLRHLMKISFTYISEVLTAICFNFSDKVINNSSIELCGLLLEFGCKHGDNHLIQLSVDTIYHFCNLENLHFQKKPSDKAILLLFDCAQKYPENILSWKTFFMCIYQIINFHNLKLKSNLQPNLKPAAKYISKRLPMQMIDSIIYQINSFPSKIHDQLLFGAVEALSEKTYLPETSVYFFQNIVEFITINFEFILPCWNQFSTTIIQDLFIKFYSSHRPRYSRIVISSVFEICRRVLEHENSASHLIVISDMLKIFEHITKDPKAFVICSNDIILVLHSIKHLMISYPSQLKESWKNLLYVIKLIGNHENQSPVILGAKLLYSIFSKLLYPYIPHRYYNDFLFAIFSYYKSAFAELFQAKLHTTLLLCVNQINHLYFTFTKQPFPEKIEIRDVIKSLNNSNELSAQNSLHNMLLDSTTSIDLGIYPPSPSSTVTLAQLKSYDNSPKVQSLVDTSYLLSSGVYDPNIDIDLIEDQYFFENLNFENENELLRYYWTVIINGITSTVSFNPSATSLVTFQVSALKHFLRIIKKSGRMFTQELWKLFFNSNLFPILTNELLKDEQPNGVELLYCELLGFIETIFSNYFEKLQFLFNDFLIIIALYFLQPKVEFSKQAILILSKFYQNTQSKWNYSQRLMFFISVHHYFRMNLSPFNAYFPHFEKYLSRDAIKLAPNQKQHKPNNDKNNDNDNMIVIGSDNNDNNNKEPISDVEEKKEEDESCYPDLSLPDLHSISSFQARIITYSIMISHSSISQERLDSHEELILILKTAFESHFHTLDSFLLSIIINDLYSQFLLFHEAVYHKFTPNVFENFLLSDEQLLKSNTKLLRKKDVHSSPFSSSPSLLSSPSQSNNDDDDDQLNKTKDPPTDTNSDKVRSRTNSVELTANSDNSESTNVSVFDPTTISKHSSETWSEYYRRLGFMSRERSSSFPPAPNYNANQENTPLNPIQIPEIFSPQVRTSWTILPPNIFPIQLEGLCASIYIHVLFTLTSTESSTLIKIDEKLFTFTSLIMQDFLKSLLHEFPREFMSEKLFIILLLLNRIRTLSRIKMMQVVNWNFDHLVTLSSSLDLVVSELSKVIIKQSRFRINENAK